MSALSVLIADDEENICVLLEQWFKALGHTVKTAHSGAGALKLLGDFRADLVVTDILMPDGDGVTLINGVRKMLPGARILAISGGGRYMDGTDYLKIAKGLGADGAILKPFTRVQFMQAVETALAKRETNFGFM